MKEEVDGLYQHLDASDDLSVEAPSRKKWYKRWYWITIFAVFGVLFCLGLAMGMIAAFNDFGQCTRSCRLEFCSNSSMSDTNCLLDSGIKGWRTNKASKKKCTCLAPKLFEGMKEINRYVKAADTWSFDEQETRYCAVPINSTDGFGITYLTKEEVDNDNALILHKGPCGQCSSISDKEAYNVTAHNLTHISKMGAILSIFSRKLARKKMETAKLNNKCNECWIENMHQTLVHCFGKCARIYKSNCKENGEINDCLYCDEVHSGMYFRRCAGMTRRRAGIETDICRKPGEIVTD